MNDEQRKFVVCVAVFHSMMNLFNLSDLIISCQIIVSLLNHSLLVCLSKTCIESCLLAVFLWAMLRLSAHLSIKDMYWELSSHCAFMSYAEIICCLFTKKAEWLPSHFVSFEDFVLRYWNTVYSPRKWSNHLLILPIKDFIPRCQNAVV